MLDELLNLIDPDIKDLVALSQQLASFVNMSEFSSQMEKDLVSRYSSIVEVMYRQIQLDAITISRLKNTPNL